MEVLSREANEEFVISAFNAGIPKEQLLNLIKGGYVPLLWQMRFHAACRKADRDNGPVKIGVGGARGPGKSHAVFAQVTLDDCQRIPGLKCLFLRQTGKAAKESFEDLVFRVLAGRVNYEYNHSLNTLVFPNGSKVILGGFHTEKDIDQYIGIEYDLIAVEELNQLVREKIEKLLGSMRTSKENWRPRLYASFNPGGIGHLFVKNLFVDPYFENRQANTSFFPATYRDNPYLNKEYIDYLEGLEGALGKAWREGSFDVFEGQFFEEWDRTRHICTPFPIPASWKKFRAYDHGRENPACCLWFALDYDGRVWVYREFYYSGLNVDQIAREINRLSQGETYEYSVADPSIFAKHGFVDAFGGQTIAESFARQGVTFIPASNRRPDGWALVHQFLSFSKAEYPKLIVFNVCHNLIRTLPTMIHDQYRPEDVDTNTEDHAVDSLRYFLLSLHEGKTQKPLTNVEKKLKEMYNKDNLDFNRFYSGDLYRG